MPRLLRESGGIAESFGSKFCRGKLFGAALIDFEAFEDDSAVVLSAGDFSFSRWLEFADVKKLGPKGSATSYFNRVESVLDSAGEPVEGGSLDSMGRGSLSGLLGADVQTSSKKHGGV